MSESSGYAVFLFPQALEALADAVKPYLQTGPAGPFVPCKEVDTGGAFIEMMLEGRSPDGRVIELELMVPGNMVRMIVSAHSESGGPDFGFYNRKPTPSVEPGLPPTASANTAAISVQG